MVVGDDLKSKDSSLELFAAVCKICVYYKFNFRFENSFNQSMGKSEPTDHVQKYENDVLLIQNILCSKFLIPCRDSFVSYAMNFKLGLTNSNEI